MNRIRVLIVDDSVVIRSLLRQVLAQENDVEVVGVAANGRIALQMLDQCSPELVTLDIEMPEMNGLEALSELRKTRPKLPVVMFSTLTERGAVATLEAFSLGASDYVTKPSNSRSGGQGIEAIREQLLPKIRALCRRVPIVVPAILESPHWSTTVPRFPAVLAIGCSTGGPNALSQVLPLLPKDFPLPVLVVQHMPPTFTRFLAERLNKECVLPVSEVRDGETVQPGHIWIAAGNLHMTVKKTGLTALLHTSQEPPENSCRPAVDVLFRSVAQAYRAGTFGVVMTGMGQDGLRGCQAVRAAGGTILVQDEASSVVWGMPGFVARAGLADRVLPLREIGLEIIRRVSAGTTARGA
ncbi:MAG TPA: chemotaxis response regulator protein-glutamate methylesterase [Candidatus Koribacter sp.]